MIWESIIIKTYEYTGRPIVELDRANPILEALLKRLRAEVRRGKQPDRRHSLLIRANTRANVSWLGMPLGKPKKVLNHSCFDCPSVSIATHPSAPLMTANIAIAPDVDQQMLPAALDSWV